MFGHRPRCPTRSFPLAQSSESQLQSELNVSPAQSASALRDRYGAGDAGISTVAIEQQDVRKPKLGVIQQIESFGSELQLRSLLQGEGLRKTEVHHVRSGGGHRVLSNGGGVRQNTGRRQRKGTRI